MEDRETIQVRLFEKEGKEEILYPDPNNPYESCEIRARIVGGALTINDSECGHAPDGGWSHRTIVFDRENTEKVFAFLLDACYDPFRALKNMINYNDGLIPFLDACNERGIKYESRWSF